MQEQRLMNTVCRIPLARVPFVPAPGMSAAAPNANVLRAIPCLNSDRANLAPPRRLVLVLADTNELSPTPRGRDNEPGWRLNYNSRL